VPEAWLLIAARAPGAGMRTFWQDAADLAVAGQDVTLVLTDDAVRARITTGSPVRGLRERGVRVMVEQTAAVRRGVASRLTPDELMSVDELAGLLLDPRIRTVWR
jgi:hypothetical protein